MIQYLTKGDNLITTRRRCKTVCKNEGNIYISGGEREGAVYMKDASSVGQKIEMIMMMS